MRRETRYNVDYMTGKVPPQNVDVEKTVLGSVFIDPESLIKITDTLKAEDFYEDRHRIIFDAILDLYGDRKPVDMVSVSSRLRDKQMLESVGGVGYLAELSESISTSAHIQSYAEIIADKNTLRQLVRIGGDITELGYKEDEDVSQLLDQSEQKLFAVSQKHLKKNFVPMKDILVDAFDRFDEMHNRGDSISGVPTGFKELDTLLSGFQKSDLIILAARPSVGKTSLAMDVARQAAKSDVPVAMFSLEMSKEQLADRMLSSESGIDLWKLRNGKIGNDPRNDEYRQLNAAMNALASCPIFIDDSGTLNIMELRTKARRLKMEQGLGLIIIDYLQLMEGRFKSTGDNRTQEVSDITRSLKSVARELDIPIVALSQLSRLVEQRNPAIPRLADLRESGSIEQDADIVMFIYRKAMDKSQNCPEEERRIAEIHISKHRNGPTGTVQLFFNEERTSFSNLDTVMHDPFSTP